MDIRLLRDLYDMADYYNNQLQLLDLQSYNGLSNAHKKAHTIASIESSMLKNIMHIFHSHPGLVTAIPRQIDEYGLKVIDFIASPTSELQNYENEILSKYQVKLTIEHIYNMQSVKVKFSLRYKGENEEQIDIESDTLSRLGLEVVYTIENIKALVALYFCDEDQDKIYPLIAPGITNIVDDKTIKGKGRQDSHLLIPDLHTRILELAAKLEHISKRTA